jgi:hypothetical protein
MKRISVQQGWNVFRFFFSVFLLAFYLIVGGLFLFTDVWADLLPKGRFITGIILTLFGLLRFYVAYKRYATKKIKIREKRLGEMSNDKFKRS